MSHSSIIYLYQHSLYAAYICHSYKWTYPVEYLDTHLSYITQIKLPTDNITDIGK